MTQTRGKTGLESILGSGRPAWRIALALNTLTGAKSADARRMGAMYERYHDRITESIGEAGSRAVSSAICDAARMVLDFSTALTYVDASDEGALHTLQESAILYGEADVTEAIMDIGEGQGMHSLLIGHEDYQAFLARHALPKLRLIREEADTYSIDADELERMLSKIERPKEAILRDTIEHLDEAGNENPARTYIFAKALGDESLIRRMGRTLSLRLSQDRKGIDKIVASYAKSEGQSVRKIQGGDASAILPTAAHLYLLAGKKDSVVLKEDIVLHVDPSTMNGYQRESDLLARIDHPNIVHMRRTHEIGGIGFMELDLVRGETLAKYTDRTSKAKLDHDEILCIGAVLCDTLRYLHEQNIIYMDLKDRNVMFDREGLRKDGLIDDHVTLLDFGMARLVEGNLDETSSAYTVLSTPKYMSAELAGFRAVPATDVYQLGVLLYELLTKRHPYLPDDLAPPQGGRESEVIIHGLATLHADYQPTKTRYDPLLRRMLDKDPSARPGLDEVYDAIMDLYEKKFHHSIEQKEAEVVSVDPMTIYLGTQEAHT
ncbi:MAG: serine/threonine-protein kinase [Nanoarchaeota archaeon]